MTGPSVSTDDPICQVTPFFPLTSPARQYLAWTAAANSAAEILNASCVLALSAYELSRRGFRMPRPSDGTEYPLTTWFSFVGNSGTGKSSAINAIQEFSRTCWKAASLSFVDPWIEPEGSIQGLANALQSRYSKLSETTPAFLQHNEFSSVLASTKQPISDALCRIADGRTLEFNYVSRQKKLKADDNADRVVRPRVSALFATTETALLSTFKMVHRGGGLFARLIWVAPTFHRHNIRMVDDYEGATPTRVLQSYAEDSFTAWFAGLSMLAAESGWNFVLSREAHDCLAHELFTPFQKAYVSDAADDHMHGVRMRLIEKARVFAAIHASWRGSLRIECEDIAFTVPLVTAYYQHALKMAHLGSSDFYRLIQRTEALVLSTGDSGTTRTQLYRALRTDKRTLDQILETLHDANTVYSDPRRDVASSGKLVHILTAAGRDVRDRLEMKAQASAHVPDWRKPLVS